MLLEERGQDRTRLRFLVQVFAVHDSLLTEAAATGDVSSGGSRLLTARLWEPGLQVDLKSPAGNPRAGRGWCTAVLRAQALTRLG